MDNKIELGLIGCGLRGTGYPSYMQKMGINFVVKALADIDESNLMAANAMFAQNKAQLFMTGEDLIESTNLDAVVVATPNTYHRGPAIAAIKKHIPMLLEKPIATSLEDLKAMWQAYIENDGKIVVGFCLRYTPFYEAIKKIITKGVLGQILTIHAEELMSDRLSMIFCRSQWRNDPSQSGGLLLEKCCHDIDLLNWFSDSQALKISSHAIRSFLIPNKGPKRICDNCPEETKCRFSRNKILKSFGCNESETQTENHDLHLKLINNQCPYFTGTAYPDHQSVIIEYKNGILCTFNVVQMQPSNRRTIHILGTQARLYGVIDDNSFVIYHRTGPNDEKPEVIKVQSDNSGHNGADNGLTRDFLDLIEQKPNPQRPGLREGIESALMCIAADESAELGRSIELSESRSHVFDYDLVNSASRKKNITACK